MSSYDEGDAFEAASVPLSQRAMTARGAPYLDGLNPAQREAVETVDGPVLMLAGAGTGKTRALMARIAHLITLGRAQSDEILAVTFTNKAAREMKDRLEKTPFEVRAPIKWMGTFHALSAKLLRRHAELAGLKTNFTILDTDDQVRLLRQLVIAANIDEKRWPARQLASIIDNWKNRAWTPDKVPVAETNAFNQMGVELYAQYQERLKALNAVDFGDLLLHVVTIFQTHEDVLKQYQRWFRFILVDEYQDTNVAQYLWLRLLAGGHKNICCVGDDDQSIYGWRGAEVGNILRFEKDFPGAKVVRLEQNYRSTPHILAAASGVIAANAGRLGKTLWTEANDGEKLRLIGHWDGEEEARWIGEELEAMQGGTRGQRPMSLNESAILVRASHQMEPFADRFLSIGLPYRIVGPRLDDSTEVRDAHAYFKVTVSRDNDLAFERIVNTPKRGLGKVALQKIRAAAQANEISQFEASKLLVNSGELRGTGASNLKILTEAIDRWHAVARDSHDPVGLVGQILDESGYTEMWQNTKTPDAEGRLENLKTVRGRLEKYESLQEYLEYIELRDSNDTDAPGEKVSIMTLHAAKGLEFPAVFLPGWEDGLFPSQRSMDESGLKGLEEERRLAYVGITRAEEICTISFAANRRVYGQWQSALPSRFIDELPEEHVDVLTPPGLYGGGYGAAGMAAGSTLEDAAASANVYNSPGWRRLQERGSSRPMSQPRESRNSVIDLDAVSAFTQGDRVFHTKFGYGYVMGVEGDKLDIEFEKAGAKKVVAKFIVAADRADDVPF